MWLGNFCIISAQIRAQLLHIPVGEKVWTYRPRTPDRFLFPLVRAVAHSIYIENTHRIYATLYFTRVYRTVFVSLSKPKPSFSNLSVTFDSKKIIFRQEMKMGASAVVTVALLGLVLCATIQTLGGDENVGETVLNDESIDDQKESGVQVEIIEESKECSRYVS